MPKNRSLFLALLAVVLLTCVLYITYGIERFQTYPLLLTYTLAFAAYAGIYKLTVHDKQLWVLLGLSGLVRIVLLPAIPNLSDDIYRFIWDGRLLVQGIHPFAYLPSEIIEQGLHKQLQGIDESLFQRLNSPNYFSIYPPVNQAVFALAAWVYPDSILGSIVLIRICILLAEAGSISLLFQFARRQGFPIKRTLLYALNPLIILELSGNLHFEALMIFFLLLSYFFLRRVHWLPSAFSFALAIATKLLPLVLLPLYIRRLGIKKSLWFYIATGVFTLLLFIPLLNMELLRGIGESVGLYFQKFEFNASIYYIVREIGYVLKGYNIIGMAGKWLAVSTFLGIVLFSILERKEKLPAAWLWVWVIYLALATTVHPWYIAPLIAFSLFTHYRFMIVWSWLIFFSYAGYSVEGFKEILPITVLEYSLVLLMLAYELWKHYSTKAVSSSTTG
ncbi:alpha-1,6-mannosyltransferase [Catalinimonas alkaloidigena]|uniref:hypothetical protein n=1 Tax=Catalinimonas alkaloidigena TaxID=1075417 RepID=UPI002406D5B9|nr:hypothetical protein [Catalinimonas alkaloidigena]MDF9800073.1 alpha-1,6-mannosyltransferase [Catalinimonas alkaloidigena]